MKTALITGGSRGIGRELVLGFVAEGYRVAFTYLNSEERARTLAAECGALAIKADSRSERDIFLAVEAVRRELGKIDVLINNAAISSFSLVQDITLDMWNDTMAVNLTAPFLYTKAVLPDMISHKWGRIINISSMWGIVGASCESHYSTTKAGLIGLTKSLAKELGPSGITVNAVAPGLIATEMNKNLGEDVLLSMAEDTPVGRIGTASDVVNAALFLAKDCSGFITGEVMNVSGGYVI